MAAMSKSSARTRRALILSGCILLALLVLVIIPTGVEPASGRERNELEFHDEMSRAADEYMLSHSMEDRQAAARRLRSIRAGSDPQESIQSQQMYAFLRGGVIIVILVLGYNLTALYYPRLRLSSV